MQAARIVNTAFLITLGLASTVLERTASSAWPGRVAPIQCCGIAVHDYTVRAGKGLDDNRELRRMVTFAPTATAATVQPGRWRSGRRALNRPRSLSRSEWPRCRC